MKTVVAGPTMQFEINSMCPETAPTIPPQLRKKIRDILPFIVWVYWPSREPRAHCSSDRCYEVTLASVVDLWNALGLPMRPQREFIVCGHMGRLHE